MNHSVTSSSVPAFRIRHNDSLLIAKPSIRVACYLWVLLAAFALPLRGQESVDRSVTGGEVWRAANSPHVVRGLITIEEGASLTIEPGTVVEFSRDFRSGIVVRGRL